MGRDQIGAKGSPIPVSAEGGVSGEGPVPVRLGSVSTGIDPMHRGPASLEGPPSLLSQQSEWSLQGLYRD